MVSQQDKAGARGDQRDFRSKADRASVQVQNFATTFTTLMMFICAYALRQSGNHLYFLMATEKILHLKLVCLVVTSESV